MDDTIARQPADRQRPAANANPAAPPTACGLTRSGDMGTVRPVMHMIKHIPATTIGLLLLTRPAS